MEDRELDKLVATEIMDLSDELAPSYTFAMTHIWSLIEKMLFEGYHLHINCYEVGFYKWETDDTPPYSYTRFYGKQTAKNVKGIPRAICLAALKAKGVDINE